MPDRDYYPNTDPLTSTQGDRNNPQDAFSGIVIQRSSDSRYALSVGGYPTAGSAGGTSPTPLLPGMNAFAFYTEQNGDLIHQGHWENTLLALRTGVSQDNVFSYDGTFGRNLNSFISTSTYQLQTRAIVYNPYYRNYIQVGNNAIDGTPCAYKWEETGLTDISSGMPSGEYRYGTFLRSTANAYFAAVSGGNTTLVQYDNTSWSSVTSISGEVIQMTPFFDDDEFKLCIATTGAIITLNFNTGEVISDYTPTGTIQDISSTAWKLWVADLSGTTLTIKRHATLPGIYTTDFTISDITQAIFGSEYGMPFQPQALGAALLPSGRRPRGIYLATAPTDTTIAANVYRRNPSNGSDFDGSNPDNKWELEASIYTGGETDTSQVGNFPFYLTSATRLLRNGFVSLRKQMLLALPYNTTLPGSASGDSVDLWGRVYQLRNKYFVPQWRHAIRFQDFTIEDSTNFINPMCTARLYF